MRRRAERAVRRAVAGAVAGDQERFGAAVTSIQEAKTALAGESRDLAFEIGEATLLSIHHDQIPSDVQLKRLASEFARIEKWSGIDRSTVLDTLTALLAGPPFPTQTPLSVVVALDAWLLSAFIPDEVEWTDFLDGILNRLEAA